MPIDVVVAGQVARDLVLRVAEAPGAGSSVAVRSRREVLGGKGANQAVGLAQLGLEPTLVGVTATDHAGSEILEQAGLDGIDTSGVVRRRQGETALIVDVVDDHGQWRYLEHVPDDMLLTSRDVAASGTAIAHAATVVVQLQQPTAAALEAVRLARRAGARVVLDGAVRDERGRAELLAGADVVRADGTEAELLTGRAFTTEDDAVAAARELIAEGPSLVVFEVSGKGNVFVESGRHEFLPHVNPDVVDTTGAGDALVAALTATLTRGGPVREAARLAAAAAGAAVGHAGGRPDLTPAAVTEQLSRLDAATGAAD
ncbi:ribokinase [Prauserella shujinwangii]|uniref:Ribokinase n=1 Tax=Prauserella shujinwangii TaxID=1453103 RepID=A0A2T0LSB5_9PSEU|nr:PfkB family carbohydrate kinase [Prauserella shujinwangii]PRX46544.1 ribokinase [Prauserella shujinwangii]